MKKIQLIIALIIIFLIIISFFIYQYTINNKNKFQNKENYSIKEIPNFLTKEECDYIINISINDLIESKVYEDEDIIDNTTRISKQCWLKDKNNEFIHSLSQRIAKETNTDISNQEDLQVVKYNLGGFYKPHFDACDIEKYDCERMNKNMGPRFLTFLIYLNNNFTGGETFFPKINKKIKPEIGKAVIFYNIDNKGKILPKALHGGLDIKNGEKWIANKWIHTIL